MAVFSTEFPIRKGMTDAAFVVIVQYWISGIARSKLDSALLDQEDADSVFVLSSDGEEQLEMRRCINNDGSSAIGARYETDRTNNLKFTIDTVVTRSVDFDVVSVRARSETLTADVRAPTPQKPAIIKAIFERGYGSEKPSKFASIKPYNLKEHEVEFGAELMRTGDQSGMPFIYLSRTDRNTLPLDPTKIANDVAGLANVYVEPSRSYSFRLADMIGGRNPYAGAVGLWFVNSQVPHLIFQNGGELIDTCRRMLIGHQANRALRRGLDWAGLLESQTRQLRAKVVENSADTVTTDQVEELQKNLQNTIQEKDREILQLQAKLQTMESTGQGSIQMVVHMIEQALELEPRPLELYEGELAERVVAALRQSALSESLDPRTKSFVDRVINNARLSDGARNLRSRIQSSASDPKRMKTLMQELGYEHSEEGKHHKFRPKGRLLGVGQFSMSKTTSDHRSGKNLASEVVKGLHLKNLL